MYPYDGGQQAGLVPTPGQSVYPPQFSYGYGPQSGVFGAGALGSAAVGTLGAAPTAALGVGAAAGFASMFSPSPVLHALSYMDPTTAGFNMGMSRFGAARAAGMTMSGALGVGASAAAPPLAVGAALLGTAAYASQQFMSGGGDQQALNAQLSGLPFANAASPTFSGFGFRQTQQIGQMMRQFDSADPFTSMRDLNQLMGKFTNSGMEQGIRDAKEFSKKFLSYVDSVREIATELGTTLGGASQVFAQMRQTGFYSSADVLGNTRSLQVARGLGMGDDAFFGMQSRASTTTRQAMMSGQAGARTATRFSRDALLGASDRASGGVGLFSGEDLMDITGAGTAGEAAAMMGEQFTGLMTNFLTRTPTGRAMLLGVGKQEDGRFTGGVDKGLLGRFARGEVGLEGMSELAGSRSRSSRAQTSFVTNEARIASSLMESESGFEAAASGLEQTARRWAERTGADEEDAIRLYLQKVVRADELMAEKVQELLQHREDIRGAALQRVRSEQTAAAMRLEMTRNRTFAGVRQRLEGTLEDTFAPVRQAGANVGTAADELGLRLEDGLFGVSRTGIRAPNRGDFATRLMAGRTTATATGPDFSDLPSGTALRSIGAASGVSAAMDMRRRFMLGSMSDSDRNMGLNPETQAVLGRGMTEERLSSLRMISARYNMATGTGDSVAAAAAKEELFLAAREMGPGLATSGERKQMAAFVAEAVGASNMARDIMLEGSVAFRGHGDVNDLKSRVRAAAGSAGLSSAQAEVLAEGGEGSRLLAFMAEKGMGRTALQDFAASDVGLAAGSNLSELTSAFNRQNGTDFGVDEFTGAYGITSSIKGRKAVSGGSGRQTGFQGTMPGVSPDDAFDALGRQVLATQDATVALAEEDAVRASLASAPAAVRRRLGSSLSRLEGLDPSAASYGPDAQAAYGGLANRLMAGDLDGVAGGSVLSGIGARMRRSRGSVSGIMEEYGFGSREELFAAAGRLGIETSDDSMSRGDLDTLVERLGGRDVRMALASGVESSVFLRGQTHEERTLMLIQEMGALAAKNREFAESVDKVVTSINESPIASFFGD